MEYEDKVEHIRPELRQTLTDFLSDVRYQKEFQVMSNIVGCTSRKPDKYRAALFTVDNNEIGFVIGELTVMFVEWQVEKALLANPEVVADVDGDPARMKQYIEAAKMYMYEDYEIPAVPDTEIN